MSLNTFFGLMLASLMGSAAFAACPAGHQPYQGSDSVCINSADKEQPLFMVGCEKATAKLALKLIRNVESQTVASQDEELKLKQLSGLMRDEYNLKCANIDTSQEKSFLQNWLKN